MRSVRTAFLAASVLVAAASICGAAATGAFDTLVLELRVREAGLASRSDPRSARQFAAVRRSLTAIGGSRTLVTDCRAAGQTAVLISRAFPGDFVARPPVVSTFAADFSDFVGDAFQRVTDEVLAARAALAARVPDLPAPVAVRVSRALDDADVWIGRAFRAGGFRTTARDLARAASAIARGTSIADSPALGR